jgi:diacylglycerol kinase (ATP)
MPEFFRSRARSFQYAFSGWWHVLRTQKNTWIHAVITIAVLILAFFLRLSTQDIAIIVIMITMVWAAEFINTAIEAVIDLASPQLHPLAKIGKDVSAASVLISAFAAVIVGILILGPPFFSFLNQFIHLSILSK